MKSIFLILFLLPMFLSANINYEVNFSGLKDKQTLKAIENASSLISLQKKTPRSVNALRYRAENDKDILIKVLHSYGYYDAQIKIDLEESKNYIIVYVFIIPGPRYVLKSIKLYKTPCAERLDFDLCDITLEKIGLKLEKPAIASDILRAEKLITYQLSNCGYPLAKIENKNIIVDVIEKAFYINWCIDPGQICYYGPTSIEGLKNIEKSYIENKVLYKQGDLYKSNNVVQTQIKLLETNLFSSVSITHAKELNERNELPLNIKVIEALHKNISVGASYATIDGFGTSLTWVNRNFRNVGEILRLDFDIAQRMHSGVATYKKPDFLTLDQDYVLTLEATREKIPKVYLAFTYGAISRIDRQVNKRLDFSYGIEGQYINVTHSANDGKFFLVGLPIFLKFRRTNHLLNATKGYMFIYNAAPYANIINNENLFFKQTLTNNFYLPISKSHFLILAFRLQFGSLIGPNPLKIPMTKLFLGGSDDDLRGYRYRSVGPYNKKDEIIGGRSAIYFTLEPRLRITTKIGVVPFWDMGSISSKQYPNFDNKWFKSYGIGLRYFSFFGPLRLDVGFPLDRRKDLDPKYRIYASIGQSF